MVLVFQRRAKLAAAFPTLQSFAIVAALQFGIPAWADEVPVGFIRAYLPKDAKRTDIAEITSQGRTVSLDVMPVYLRAGDTILIKPIGGAVEVAYGDGSSATVAFDRRLKPYVVPGVASRPDWREIFRPKASPRPNVPEALTAGFQFLPDFGEFHPVDAYVSATTPAAAGQAIARWTEQDPIGNLVEKYATNDLAVSEWQKTGIVAFAGKPPERWALAWKGGTPPFKVEVFPQGKYSLPPKLGEIVVGKTTKYSEVPRNVAEVFTPMTVKGWSDIRVTDAQGRSIRSQLLVADPQSMRECPFASATSVTLEAAVVCARWRQANR